MPRDSTTAVAPWARSSSASAGWMPTVPLGLVAVIRIGMHWSVLVMVILIGWLLGA